jgi:cephalosporin hydroxylase
MCRQTRWWSAILPARIGGPAVTEPEAFQAERRLAARAMAADPHLRDLTDRWLAETCKHQYSYNFTWLGLPIIQYPQDVLAMQEVIWKVQPDLIIETGIARGGSLVFYASLLQLLGGTGRVVGIDIDIRAHNRLAIESHPLAARITMVQGSSVDEGVVAQARAMAAGKQRVLVVLDSLHTHDHVLEELRRYSPLVTRGSYLVVFDTVIEQMPRGSFPDRRWDRGNNPLTAVRQFLKESPQFEIDSEISAKLLVTVAPDGFLRCIKD